MLSADSQLYVTALGSLTKENPHMNRIRTGRGGQNNVNYQCKVAKKIRREGSEEAGEERVGFLLHKQGVRGQ